MCKCTPFMPSCTAFIIQIVMKASNHEVKKSGNFQGRFYVTSTFTPEEANASLRFSPFEMDRIMQRPHAVPNARISIPLLLLQSRAIVRLRLPRVSVH